MSIWRNANLKLRVLFLSSIHHMVMASINVQNPQNLQNLQNPENLQNLQNLQNPQNLQNQSHLVTVIAMVRNL